MSPAKRRRTVERVVVDLHVPERRVCRALGQPRSTQRYRARVGEEGSRLVQDIVRLATSYGRYGYRRVTELLRREVNATVWSPGEFHKKRQAGQHFLKAVLKAPRVLLIGSENELG